MLALISMIKTRAGSIDFLLAQLAKEEEKEYWTPLFLIKHKAACASGGWHIYTETGGTVRPK
jgi:hypothetical protein